MSTNILDAMTLSAFGMRAQGDRIRVISENIANVSSTSNSAGGDPYRRQMVSFKDTMDRDLDMKVVKATKAQQDTTTDFEMKYLPGHPAADASGYVKMPNVNMAFEMADMREAQRSYEANLSMLEMSRSLVGRLVELLRG
jgi:flagellar basal-body rod protein FlgC